MKNTFGGSLRNSPPIIMGGVLMFRSERMRRTGARSTASGTSSPMQSWADCITGTHESSFWKRQSVMKKKSQFRSGRGAKRFGPQQQRLLHNVSPTMSPELASAFSQALALHQAGRLADAEKMYRIILKAQPDHFDSLHLLGVIFHPVSYTHLRA